MKKAVYGQQSTNDLAINPVTNNTEDPYTTGQQVKEVATKLGSMVYSAAQAIGKSITKYHTYG